MKRTALLLCLILACAPKPVRPLATNPDQKRELKQCDYLYSQCLGKPSSLNQSDDQPNPLDWQGEPAGHCNKKLKSCYERAVRQRADSVTP